MRKTFLQILLIIGSVVLIGVGYMVWAVKEPKNSTTEFSFPKDKDAGTVETIVKESESLRCSTTLGSSKLVESTIYVGEIETGYEIAPVEDDTYDLVEESPSKQPYYLTCYYDSGTYMQKEVPRSITQCAFEAGLLVCS